MRQLDNHSGGHHARCIGISELRGQKHEQRAKPLAAGLNQIARGVSDERIVARYRIAQLRLDAGEGCGQARIKSSIREGNAEKGLTHRVNVLLEEETSRVAGAAAADHRMKTSALLTSSSTGCGTMPNTMVTVVAAASAMVVYAEGMTTVAVSSVGSEKNINTMTRA